MNGEKQEIRFFVCGRKYDSYNRHHSNGWKGHARAMGRNNKRFKATMTTKEMAQ